MKQEYFKKISILLFFLISFCHSLGIDIGNDIRERINDINFYNTIQNIERSVEYRDGRTLDIYYRKNEKINELKPVFIFIYGGAWISGDSIKYSKIGSFFERNDYIGVIPNYVLFPNGSLEDMIQDIYTAINWTYGNIENYGGDKNRISIAAHSAGAHLLTLTLFKSYNLMVNNGIYLSPLPELEKVILLSGPYDFDDYPNINKYKNNDNKSNIIEQAVKIIFNSKTVSPYDIVKAMEDNSVVDGFRVKKFIFYHASEDRIISQYSAEKLIKEMRRVSENVNIIYVYKEGYSHVEITSGIRNDRKEPIDYFYTLLNL